MSLSKTEKFNSANHRWNFHWKKDDDYGAKVIARIAGRKSPSDNEGPAFCHNEMRFSLLICTIPERQDQFDKLWDYLFRCWSALPVAISNRIEVIAITDERRLTIGEKRNLLLEMASGDYVAFLDDDDWLNEMYFMKIWGAILKTPDCIGFMITCVNYPGVGQTKLAECGIGKEWKETATMIYRPPYHKTPVRREIAAAARFPHKSFGEDAEYANRIRDKIKTVQFIPEPLYIYNAPLKPSMKRYEQRN